MLLDGNLLLTLEDLFSTLDEDLDAYDDAGRQLAEAESAYNILLRQKALAEKDAGVSVTFIDKFLKGDPEIAQKRKQRDIAEAWRDTLKEKIQSVKLQIRIIESQVEREWNSRQGGY